MTNLFNLHNTTIKPATAQIVWEILNASLHDLTQGNPADAVEAIQEAIDLLESEGVGG